MSRAETNVGALGWGIAVGTALAFDCLAEQTMSQWYRDRVNDPKTRPVALGALAVMAFHFARPETYPFRQIDPVTRVGEFIRDLTYGKS